MTFELHPQLASDTLPVASLALSELLLMNDARFPWCILVPRRPDVREWHHLSEADLLQVMREVSVVSEALETLPGTSKLNVGALGNRVTQLHIHVVARHPDDDAWPDPVWGFGSASAYADDAAAALVRLLREAVADQTA